MKLSSLFSLAILTLLCAAERSAAADPSVQRVLPRGGTRGTEIELTLAGQRLDDAAEILFYEPGISVKSLKADNAQTVKAALAIAPDARLGEYHLRLRTATGLSQLRTFFVGALPVVEEKEPNNDAAANAQKIDLNVTVAGGITNEDVDCYVVEAKKGQRLTAEVEGMRLATGMLDPFVAILDEDRRELASDDDSTLFLQDPVVSIVTPKDGRYTILVRDSSYGGSNDTLYRLHVGTFPRPAVVYPAGGQAGHDLSVQFLGDPSGPIAQTLKLPGERHDHFEILAEQSGQLSPSNNVIRVSTFPNVLESEPNDTPDKATSAATGSEIPLALNGIIERPGDIDSFKFTAKKGRPYHVNAYARRVRSPLDSVVSIEQNGKTLAENDDTNGPDSRLTFTAPDDGELTLRVRDKLGDGGPQYVYRVEIVPAEPKLKLALPFYDQNNTSQERQTIVVPRGNRFATLVRVTRSDFGGEVALSSSGLPDGVAMSDAKIPDNSDVVPVVFEAKADAPIAARLAELTGKSGDVTGTFSQQTTLVPNGNDPPFYTTSVDKLAVAVADEAPFKLTLVEPKAPLVQGGSSQLRVKIERKPGFDGPIRLQTVFNPPGVSAANAEIAAGASEGTVPLNAEDAAPTRKWKTCVLGSADVDGGRIWVSTQLADLEVATPMLHMKMDLARVERGGAGQVVVNVEDGAAFEGKAKAKLVGLPPNATATPEEKEFSATDKTVSFTVAAGERTPVGQHKSLLCVVTVMKNGEPVVHNLARGGVLRVDAPAAGQSPGDKSKPKPAGPVAQSRLEELRREAAAKK